MEESKTESDVRKAGITPLQQAISSCSGALITSVFVTPLDVVKIRLQAQAKPFKKGSCFVYSNGLMDCLCVCSYCTNGNGNGNHGNGNHGNGVVRNGNHGNSVVRNGNLGQLGMEDIHRYEFECPNPRARTKFRPWYERPGYFNGTLDAFIKITRNEGITSLWSGLPPTLVMAVPATVVYFTCYDQLKYKMGYREGDPSTSRVPLLAGSVARVIAATMISPLELIRTKMQSQQLSYTQVGEALRVTVRHGGLLSMMRGLGPTLLRDVPFSALYWYGYELVKAQQLRTHNTTELSFSQSFMAGAISGTTAAVLTLPFDVVKTHRQIELGEAEVLKGKQVSSTWKIMLRILQHDGASGLFTGIVPRVVKVAPACAIMISSYEYGKQFFHKRNLQPDNKSKWL